MDTRRQRRPTWDEERRDLLDGMRDLLRRNADPIDTFHGVLSAEDVARLRAVIRVLSGLRTVRKEKT